MKRSRRSICSRIACYIEALPRAYTSLSEYVFPAIGLILVSLLLSSCSLDVVITNMSKAMTVPELKITGPGPALGNSSTSFEWTVTYNNYDNISLAAGNVTINATGATCAGKTVSGSGTVRVITLSGCTGDGAVGITVDAGSAIDLAGNQAPSASGSSATVDNTSPTITVGAATPVLGNSSASFSWTYTYTGADVITLNDSDVLIEPTGTVNSCTKAVSISGNTGTVTLSGCLGDGTVKVSIAAGSGKDNAGNLTLADSTAVAVTVDNLVPAVPVINMYSPTSSPGAVSTPQLQATNIVSGDIVSLYTDNACTTQVATATAGSTSLILTTTALAAGTYNFYVKSQDLAGNSTACVNPGVNYVYIACASNQRLVEGSCASPIVVTLSATTNDPGIYLSASTNFVIELESDTPGVVTSSTQGGASDNALTLYPNGSTTVTVSLWPSKLNLTGLQFCSAGSINIRSIKTLESMGSYKVQSGYRMFAYCKEFTTISDLTSFSAALSGATSFESMFEYATAYNQALPSNLDTSNVTNMANLFYGASSYNQALPVSFDTSNVMNMAYMFGNASSYNQALPVSFDTSNVTNMNAMFLRASSYNQALPSSFNTSNVTNMSAMFFYATAYNQALPSSFNTSNVTNMAKIFYYATAYNQALPVSFDTSNVTNMSGMFGSASSYNQALPVSFDTSNVTDMSEMFSGASSYNQALPVSFDTSNVTNMSGMFGSARAYNQAFPSNFDTSKVTDMSYMFAYASNYNQAFPSSFNTSKVISMYGMFNYATSYSLAFPSSFDTSNVTNMSSMFYGAYSYNQVFPSSFDTSNVTNMAYMFADARAYNQAFPPSFNTSKVISMYGMFNQASAYNQTLPASFDTSKVTDMYGMFAQASAYNQALPTSFDTSNVRNMAYMFDGASSYNQNLKSIMNVCLVNSYDGFSTSAPIDGTANIPVFGDLSQCNKGGPQ